MITFQVSNPSIYLLSFRVYDENELNNQQALFVAYAAIPLLNLRCGLRSLMLYDEKGNRKGDFEFCSLLIRVKMENLSDANSVVDAVSNEDGSVANNNGEQIGETSKVPEVENLSKRKEINLSVDIIS